MGYNRNEDRWNGSGAEGQDGSNDERKSVLKIVRTPAIILGVLMSAQLIVQPFFMFSVPTGYGAALSTGGSVHDEVYLPGPHFKMPWQSAYQIKTWPTVATVKTVTSDSNNQPVTTYVAPQVWIDPAAIPALVRNYNSLENVMKTVVEPQVAQAIRGQTSNRTPEAIIWERPEAVKLMRRELQSKIGDQLAVKGVSRDAVKIGLVALLQVAFTDPVIKTLENKAESQVKTHTANAQKLIRAIVADKDGQVTELLADGDAAAAKIIADAQAYRVSKVGEAAAAAADVAKYEAIIKWIDAGGNSSRVQIGKDAQVILNGLSVPAGK